MTTQLSIPEKALSVKEIQPLSALCFTTTATLSTVRQHAPGVAENLYREAARLNLTVAGPIQWVYTGVSGNETAEFRLEIILPISQPGAPSDEFSYKVFPGFRCASYTYTGPWSDFGDLYDALFGQLYQNGYQNNGSVREVYSVINFSNPAACVTEIQIALV
ncbi:GyrI-like domain-containing protein [Spirosoma koreense]